jgi:hypothetical protein
MNKIHIHNQLMKDFVILKEQIREMASNHYTFDEMVLDGMFYRMTSIERNLWRLMEV